MKEVHRVSKLPMLQRLKNERIVPNIKFKNGIQPAYYGALGMR